MGGIGGHLMHLYDDRGLTCLDISRIFSSLSTGQITCFEKFDGMNIAISWDARRKIPVAARSKADVAAGGLSFYELAGRFVAQPMAYATFNAAFQVLGPAMELVCPKLQHLFSGGGFVSAEIIWSGNPNVLRYDGNHIVIHRIVAPYSSGGVEAVSQTATEEQLHEFASALNSAISSGWSVSLPQPIIRTPRTVSNFDNRLIKIFGFSTTVGDLIKQRLMSDSRILWLDMHRRTMFADRLMGVRGAPTIIDITRGLTKGQTSILRAMNTDARSVVTASICDLIELVDDFAIEYLAGFQSTLIAEPSREVTRLRNLVYADSAVLSKTRDPSLVDLANRNRSRLKSLTNISAIEGIVFNYMGQNYKMTGAFAPINQIIGARKRLNQP